jgi:hypothetical protein
MTARRGTVVGVLPRKSSQTYSFRVQLLVAVAIAIALANTIGQAASQQATQENSLGAQQACAAQAVVYFRERSADVKKLTEGVRGWTIFLRLGATYSPAQNHYNQQLHRCLVAVSTVENDGVKDDLTTDVTPRLTQIEIVDPFEQARVLTCSDPIPLRLTDTGTGKTTLLPSSRGWKCLDADNHQLSIEEGIALMARLMRE